MRVNPKLGELRVVILKIKICKWNEKFTHASLPPTNFGSNALENKGASF